MRGAIGAGRLVVASTVCVAVAGCAVLGPASVEYGRSAYNEALISTNNEQVLATIVRMRYGEPASLLSVASITANLHFQTSLGSEFGFGPDNNYAGNLTPLSAGIAYEENPTVSYLPVQGQNYLRRFLSPLPLDLSLLLLASLGDSAQPMILLVRSINGIRNPDFTNGETDPRFAQIADTFAELHRGGQLAWVQEPGKPLSFSLTLYGEAPDHEKRIAALYGSLALPAPLDGNAPVTLPVRVGLGKPAGTSIALTTRSLYDLFRIAADSVEVPEEHLQSGLAPSLPPPGAAGRTIHIRGTENRPREAMVAVKHHGWWYWIDSRDAGSKVAFQLLETLLSVLMAENVGPGGTPVLTVPVSR